MPLPTIPRNTYPMHPTGYAAYWQTKETSQSKGLQRTGRVPVWVAFHDGGREDRIVHLLVVRVRPQIEVVIVSRFGQRILTDKIEQAIQKRLTKPSWPERKWWVSHIVYLAQPPKRQSKSPRLFRFDRFCMGRLLAPGGKSHMLAFIPVSRLKLNVLPSGKDESFDLRFEVDMSNQRQREIRDYVTKLSELERWERRIVHQALGHLLGTSYLEAVAMGSEQIQERVHNVRRGHASDELRSLLSKPAEDFEPVRWLKDGDHRRLSQSLLTISRFPMGNGPDPELSVRPWIPAALRGIVSPDVPRAPYGDMAMEFLPDPANNSVAIRWIVGALIPYRQ